MIAGQKLQKMGLLNRTRKRVNSAIGFTKVEDPKARLMSETTTDDVDGPIITPDFDKYKRMKRIASFFAISGFVYGALLIFFGANYGALIPENKSFFGKSLFGNDLKQENKAEIEGQGSDPELPNA